MQVANNINVKFDYLTVRHNPFDLWIDIFNYSVNLKGNWFLSKSIFHNNLLPTAKKNPRQFARWISESVKSNNLKIKQQPKFLMCLNRLRSFSFLQNNVKDKDISKVLLELFRAGLDEPVISKRALKSFNY